MPNRFTLVDDVAGDGQSVVDADGAVMARAAKKTKVSTLALMAVLGMINLSSEISARAANAKTEYNKFQVTTGTDHSDSNAQKWGMQAATITTAPSPAVNTGATFDTTSVATLGESLRIQWSALGLALDKYSDRVDDVIQVVSLFLKALGNKELWAAIGVDLSDETLMMLSVFGGSSMGFGLSTTPPVQNP